MNDNEKKVFTALIGAVAFVFLSVVWAGAINNSVDNQRDLSMAKLGYYQTTNAAGNRVWQPFDAEKK